MILRVVAAVLVLAPSAASAAVTVGTQIVDTRLAGTIAMAPVDSSGSDAATRAGTIRAAAQLVERGEGGVFAVRGRSSVVAELGSAERGRVTFQRTLTPGGNAVTASSANYRYFFTTDSEAVFEVDWGVAAFGEGADGQLPGQSVSLAARDGAAALLKIAPLGNGSSGDTQLLLAPGSYEFRIEDAFAPQASAGQSSGLSSQYSFTIRAVPEPATWVMMLVGFGAVGTAARRARKGSTFSVRRT
ncbi:MAG: PEPxxWA-CTERM sorting domain-containing protein [Sphingomonas phyllosphaerae]|uniref:PEPxxWA-CTERM sorting domain-containing protein n=1 Tax=Sphingomonas phyllosphaerae TaxID=257003 RepID=UPI002FF52B3A